MLCRIDKILLIIEVLQFQIIYPIYGYKFLIGVRNLYLCWNAMVMGSICYVNEESKDFCVHCIR